MKKKAFITGISGQDGSYLAEYLLSLDYEVYGMIRRTSTFTTERIDHIFDRINLQYGDLTDSTTLYDIFNRIKPDEFYNLGGQTHVKVSFDIPDYTANVNGNSVLRILEAMRHSESKDKCILYQASTSELFGSAPAPQSEETKFIPESPYAIAKQFAYEIIKNYRKSYGMQAFNGILFNHESPRRGNTFVTQKIIKGFISLIEDKNNIMELGNLFAKRDWGFAPEYVTFMHKLVQSKKNKDFVIGTGHSYSVIDFVKIISEVLGISIVYEENEKAIYIEEVHNNLFFNESHKGNKIIQVSEKYYRPSEVDHLQANTRLMKDELSLEAQVDIEKLVKIMFYSQLYTTDSQYIKDIKDYDTIKKYCDVNYSWTRTLCT